ncbi:hypothetical protein BH10PSE16_BH10PSE16_35340 [soil metagenome]
MPCFCSVQLADPQKLASTFFDLQLIFKAHAVRDAACEAIPRAL